MYTEAQEKKLLLKQFQSPTFKGEGAEVEKLAETWIEQLDDYFNEARTAPVNREMFGMFKLGGKAKLWWKQYCKDKGIVSSSHTWEQIKQAIRDIKDERILPTEVVFSFFGGILLKGCVFTKIRSTYD